MSPVLAITEQAAGSDTGLHRHANEDSFLIRFPVYLVADGMGGAQAGEVASQIAAESFLGELGEGRPEELLRERIEQANGQIHRLARSDPSLSGMGTTLTVAVLVPEEEEIVIGHVGDSRVYRMRGGRLEQLTRDHSLVEEMRRKGQITDEQAESHPQRSIITRALGPEPVVEVDVQTVAVTDGDVFLLCSDGLTTMLEDSRIESLIAGATSLEAAAKALIAEANRAGGRDNITVVLFRVGDSDETIGVGSAAGMTQSGLPAASGISTGGAAAAEQPTLIGESARAEGLDAARLRERGAARPQPGHLQAVQSRERSRRRRRRLRRALQAVTALVVIAALSYGALWGARQVWFLGTDSGGRVALYQGLPYELPFGIKLYSQRYSIPIQTDSLPPRRREAVTGHDLRSHEDATSLIDDILASESPAPAPTDQGGGDRSQAGGDGGASAKQGGGKRAKQNSGNKSSGQKRPNKNQR